MLSDAITIGEPANGPLALADAKSFLRVDGAALDTEIAIMVAAAHEDVEARTSLRLIDQVVELRAESFVDLEHLTVGPVQSVEEIRYVDASGVEQLLDAARYRLTGAGLDRGIVGVRRGALPSIPTAPDAIVVSLRVGYGADATAVPQRLRWAMLMLIKAAFDDEKVDIEPQLVNLRINA